MHHIRLHEVSTLLQDTNKTNTLQFGQDFNWKKRRSSRNENIISIRRNFSPIVKIFGMMSKDLKNYFSHLLPNMLFFSKSSRNLK